MNLIRIPEDNDAFFFAVQVMTVGAIKITHQMNRPHLKMELYKLNVAKNKLLNPKL